MTAVAQTVFTMSMLARIFETTAVLAVLKNAEPSMTALPPVIQDQIQADADVFDLWLATKRRVTRAARYEIEHIDDWTIKSTLVGFDL